MSSGEIYNAILQFFSGKEGELWPRQCVHLTGDIIYAQSCSESHLSQLTVEGGKCRLCYPRDNPL